MINDQDRPAPHAPAQRPVDGVSIAALVTGVLALGLVPVVLGALGLHRTRAGALRGRGLAVAGLVLGIVQTLVGAALVVVLVLGGWASFRDSFVQGWDEAAGSAATDAPTTVQGAEDLSLGDCLLEDGGPDGSDVEVVDCGQPHAAEVVDDVRTTATDFPGEDALADEADEVCWSGLEDRLTDAGLTWDGYWYGWYTPSAETWEAGDREIDCLLYPEADGATLTGSLVAGTLAVEGTGSAV